MLLMNMCRRLGGSYPRVHDHFQSLRVSVLVLVPGPISGHDRSRVSNTSGSYRAHPSWLLGGSRIGLDRQSFQPPTVGSSEIVQWLNLSIKLRMVAPENCRALKF